MSEINPSEILDFLLQGGAFISWDESHWLLSWGGSCKSSPKSEARWIQDQFYTEKPLVVYEKTALILKQDLQKVLASLSLAEVEPWNWQTPLRDDFNHQYRFIFEAFQRGQLEKAVPVVYEKSFRSVRSQDLQKILLQLLQAESGQYAYGHWSSEEGVIGLTPEILFEGEGGRLMTMALAGTKPTGSKESLLRDAKEMAEHNYVVDKIETQLHSLGEVSLGVTVEESFGAITHLKTPIQLQLKSDISIKQICRSLHPTPALGVFSQKLDHHWLKSLDQYSEPKRYFGAPIGVCFKNKTRVLVGIRNIQWFEGCTYLGSGCGVVRESKLDKEWEELKLKRNTVKQNLGLI